MLASTVVWCAFLLSFGMVFGQVLLPPGTMPVITPKDPCVEMQNITDIENMPQHKYMVLEHCLYYHLQREIDKKFQQYNAIAVLPPSDGQKQKNITVTFHRMTVQHVWLNDMMKDLHVRGSLAMSWTDERISWDVSRWKTDSLSIQSPSHLWVPQLSSKKLESAVANGDVTAFKKIRAKTPHNISAFLNFNLQAFCDVDLENYPLDVHHCCFNLQPKLYADIINFNTVNMEAEIDRLYYRKTGWNVDSINIDSSHDEEGIAVLTWCLSLSRASTTLRIELSLPMAICAILILISPLFGAFIHQLYAKMFALLLQYLSLQYLANKTAHVGMGNGTPKIFIFYEFTIAINLTSIIITLLVSVLERKRRSLPPPNWMVRASAFVNNFVCCLGVVESDRTTNNNTGESAKQYKEDWFNCFSAIHSLLMLLVLAAYVIGVTIIFS